MKKMTRRAMLGGAAGFGAATLLAACGAPTSRSASSAADAPKRVIALSTGHLDHCLALGIVPVGLAVAVSQATDSRGIPAYIQDAFGSRYDLDAITIVGERMTPDMEKVAALKPDLILSNKRNTKQLNNSLAQITKTVLTSGGSENFKSDLKVVADALRKGAQGDELLAGYERRAHDWGAARGSADTVSLVRGKGSEYLYFGTLALASIVAADAGLTRPLSQRFDDTAGHSLSFERTDLLDADWLFYAFPGDSSGITSKDVWKQLPTVRRGHAFEVDVDPWFINASVVAADRVLADMKKFMSAAPITPARGTPSTQLSNTPRPRRP
ncbi:iron-siderophore ABC transporter substrate-binding protein [Tsukamurella sp. 8F]|uniref:ABC transporter substrate-binding protein n=1 Tax=unclassified Tsukamurella TaxID=2633480 RepID=UPI0023B8F1DF|nr:MULTISPECIES: iron-siderophore ABC transporter substrate-binding protein [unclassified Tsukamurella]MDF0528383.1 iron-siderophore ABC transporter substrate-binding protein [Tsukamurella sp. 8J]MDF0586208.1 iron-siderophore ABC transporter substrate-binding protein [Tsukamurella sp. 8F]